MSKLYFVSISHFLKACNSKTRHVIFEIGIGFYPSELALIFGNYLVFSLGKKVNAKSINFTEKLTCTSLILPYSLFSMPCWYILCNFLETWKISTTSTVQSTTSKNISWDQLLGCNLVTKTLILCNFCQQMKQRNLISMQW